MKKLLLAIFVISLALTFSACGINVNSQQPTSQSPTASTLPSLNPTQSTVTSTHTTSTPEVSSQQNSQKPNSASATTSSVPSSRDTTSVVLSNSGTVETQGALTIKSVFGGQESAFVTWENNSAFSGYKAYYKKSNTSSFTPIDNQLIRKYSNFWRASAIFDKQ